MKCTSCGEVVEGESRRCPSCFNYLDAASPIGVHEAEVGGRFCVRCGKKNPLKTTECGRCGRGLEAFLPAATVVGERYVVLPDWPVLRRAGQLAVDMEREDMCTVKVGILLHCKNDDQREEAGRRLGVARNYDHANLVPMRDFNVQTRAGYAVFDYVAGRDLESLLVEEGLPWLHESRAIPLMSQCLLALEYMQARRPMLVLADLSPDNVVVNDHGRLRLLPLDFREAAPDGKGRQPYRALDSFWGKPSPGWDTYSAGALLHHLLSGQSPVSRSPWDFPPVRSFNPVLSEALERIVLRAVSSPEERYPMANYLAADLHVEYPELTVEVSWQEERPAIRPGRDRSKTTSELSLSSPGRFSRLTAGEAPPQPPGEAGRGLLRGPMPTVRKGLGRGFRPLRTTSDLSRAPKGENGTVAAPASPPAWVVEEEAVKPIDERLPAEVSDRPLHARVSPVLHWIYGEYGSILPSLAITERRIVVSTWDGELRGVSPKRGETLWSRKTEEGAWYNVTAFGSGVAGQVWSLPTRPEEKPGFQSLQLFSLTDGSFQWEHDAALCPFEAGAMGFSAAAGPYLIVLFVRRDRGAARLLALDANGAVQWVRDFSGRTEWGGVVPDGVLVWNETEGALLLESRDGEVRWFHKDLLAWRPMNDQAPFLVLEDGGDMVVLRGIGPTGLTLLVAVSLPDGEVWWQRCLGPPVGSYYDAPPCIVTTAADRVLCSIPWDYRSKFRHSVIQLDAAYGLPVWASDVRAPLQEIIGYGGAAPILLAATPLRQTHVWGPFAHYRPELPCAWQHLETARTRVGNSAFRALDPDTGEELWRAGKADSESLSFRIRTNGRDVFAAASDGRLHAYTWQEG